MYIKYVSLVRALDSYKKITKIMVILWLLLRKSL